MTQEITMDYMRRRFSFSWLVRVLREVGPTKAMRAAWPFFVNLVKLWWWDREHHVSTRGRVFTSRLGITGPSAAHARAYEATGMTVLPRVLPALNIRYKDYVFLDLGAGKGQALFHAAEFSFKRIVGLELSRAVQEVALKNCTTFRSKTQACFDIEVLCGDAADFTFPVEPLVIYLFASFDATVLSSVLANLHESVEQHPRDVLLIYHNPQHRDVVEASGQFETVLEGTDEKDFRKVGYEVFRRIPTSMLTARGDSPAPAPVVHPSGEGSRGFRVIEVDTGTDPRWGAFVGAQPHGLVYHHPLWLQVIEKVYGYKPLCLACESADETFQGVLPLFRTNGLLTGRRLSSLPHTPVAGPLARCDAATAALLQEAVQRVDREPGSWLQLKVSSVQNSAIADSLVGIPGQVTYVRELPGRVEDLRFGNSRNHARIRWSVRKASKDNLEVRCAEADAELRAWYQLYLGTMRRHMVPPRPFRFFEAAWNVLRPAGLMRLLLAEQRLAGSTRLVAGSIFLMSGRTVLYAFNGWRRKDIGQRANDAIQWRAIHDACREGYRYYDFGEVEEDNHGLAEFKIKWGSKPKRLYRYYYPAPNVVERQALAPSRGGTRFLRAAWRLLPTKVTAVLGSQLYGKL